MLSNSYPIRDNQSLTPGWQWVSTDSLFNAMMEILPVNNRCALLGQGLDPHSASESDIENHCLYCPAAYKKRGDLIVWYVDELRDLLAEENCQGWKRHYFDKIAQQPGFDNLASFAKTFGRQYSGRLPENLSAMQPFDSLIGDPIRVFAENDRVTFVRGRHRVCAARKFGLPALPIFAEIL